VATVLQCFAQIPEGHVWFGPDTYMGQNVAQLLRALVERGDAAVRAVHPDFDAQRLDSAISRFHYFQSGHCIVHHLFGDEVAERVARDYGDALIAAHLEVPSAMFGLALKAQLCGRGVVGSTSDILNFVNRRLVEAIESGSPRRLRIILGTEAGLVTSLVHQVKQQLESRRASGAEVEVIFPVASEAIVVTSDRQLPVVPGVASGDGCSLEGGCATCPYMKMNHLDAVFDVLVQLSRNETERLRSHAARRNRGTVPGFDIEEARRPLLAMREFSKSRRLPDALVSRALEHGCSALGLD
jgi:quinolinate synthase